MKARNVLQSANLLMTVQSLHPLGLEQRGQHWFTNRPVFGLTVSIPKTKHMVTGRLVEEEDLAPIALEGGKVETVKEL